MKAQILLGPIHKYRLMGVFPWPFLVHILLVCVDSYWLVYMNRLNSTFIAEQKLVWYYQFTNRDIERDEFAFQRAKTYDSVDEMRERILGAAAFYHGLEPSTVSDLDDEDITDSTQRLMCRYLADPSMNLKNEATQSASGQSHKAVSAQGNDGATGSGEAGAEEEHTIYGKYQAYPLRCDKL